ncbi:MAG: transaldolase family protein [Pirellulaceae bacterium]
MSHALKSLLDSGTKLWLDSIDPILVEENRQLGATGATSNPIIVANLLRSGRFDDQIETLLSGRDDTTVAWEMTDRLVRDAQQVFLPVWESSGGDDGYVSFELDPLLEDPARGIPHDERVAAYVESGKYWSKDHVNRLIKVPATPAGIEALAPLAAAGVPLNVTLIFTDKQYAAARDSVWQGAQQLDNSKRFKSVYSIFVSRLDVYTAENVQGLSSLAQGMVGIVNAKRIWQQNQAFWADHATTLRQEIVFASTGVKNPQDDPCKYVAALAGSDIQTNPPATNVAVVESDRSFSRQIDAPVETMLQQEIDAEVDFQKLHDVLMKQGIDKFASPQQQLLELICEKRAAFA